MVAFEQMTVVQLKERLEQHGLSKTGKKADLIARLRSRKSPGKKTAKKVARKSPAKKKTPGKKGRKPNPTGYKQVGKLRSSLRSAMSVSARKKTPTKKTPTRKTPKKTAKKGRKSSSVKRVTKSPPRKYQRMPIEEEMYVPLGKEVKRRGCEPFFIMRGERGMSDGFIVPKTAKKFNKVVFDLEETGQNKHAINFKDLKSEKEIVDIVERFLNEPITKTWFDKYNTDEYLDFKKACYRGDLLQGHIIYEGVTGRGKTAILSFGS